MKNVSRKSSVVSVVVLVAVLLFVVALLSIGFKEDKLTATPQFIEIEGWYGERIAASDIRTIDLVEELPHIAYKSNGFALGSVSKGHFRTSEGQAVKLILNSQAFVSSRRAVQLFIIRVRRITNRCMIVFATCCRRCRHAEAG
jgi:hypothetical protein